MSIVNNAFLSLSEHFMYKSVFFQQPVFLERYHGIVLTLNHVITTFVSRIQLQYLRGAIQDEFLSYLCSDKIGYEINIELFSFLNQLKNYELLRGHFKFVAVELLW